MCNCRKKGSCPLNCEFLTPKVIYRADVTNEANNDQKFYFGLAETTFKERYNYHKRDVKHIKYQYNTELTKYIWKLKNNSIQYNIHWKVVDKVYGNANLTMCKLCLTENDNNMLNKKSELIDKCRHLKKFLLKHVKKKQWALVLGVFCIFVFLNITNVFLFLFR